MKTGRWLTGIGSVVLFLTGFGHGAKFSQLQGMISASGMKAPLDAILRGCWLVFSGEMVALAVIAMVASRMGGGDRLGDGIRRHLQTWRRKDRLRRDGSRIDTLGASRALRDPR